MPQIWMKLRGSTCRQFIGFIVQPFWENISAYSAVVLLFFFPPFWLARGVPVQIGRDYNEAESTIHENRTWSRIHSSGNNLFALHCLNFTNLLRYAFIARFIRQNYFCPQFSSAAGRHSVRVSRALKWQTLSKLARLQRHWLPIKIVSVSHNRSPETVAGSLSLPLSSSHLFRVCVWFNDRQAGDFWEKISTTTEIALKCNAYTL